MADLRQQSARILDACRTGDQQTLESLFQQLDIGPNQPNNAWDFDHALAEEQRTPSVKCMLRAAIETEKIAIVNFLASTFPKLSMNMGPLTWAVDTGNVQLVETICKIDPAAANGSYGHFNVLAHACCKGPQNAEIVAVLLKYGADPNKRQEHTPPWPNVKYAVSNGMPVSTFALFFDHGYDFDNGRAVEEAIRCDRPEVVEYMFRRAKAQELSIMYICSKEELISLAAKDNNLKMVEEIERGYPQPPRKGLVGVIAGVLRSKFTSQKV